VNVLTKAINLPAGASAFIFAKALINIDSNTTAADDRPRIILRADGTNIVDDLLNNPDSLAGGTLAVMWSAAYWIDGPVTNVTITVDTGDVSVDVDSRQLVVFGTVKTADII